MLLATSANKGALKNCTNAVEQKFRQKDPPVVVYNLAVDDEKDIEEGL